MIASRSIPGDNIAEVMASMLSEIAGDSNDGCTMVESDADIIACDDIAEVVTECSSAIRDIIESILVRLVEAEADAQSCSHTVATNSPAVTVNCAGVSITAKKKAPVIRRMIYQAEEAEYNLGKPLTAALDKFFASRLTQVILMNGWDKDKVKGWVAEVSKRVGGMSQGIITVTYKSPVGKRFKSRIEVASSLSLLPSPVKGSPLTRQQIFMCATELRERHLLTHQLNIFKGSCDNVVYIGDLIRIVQAKGAVGSPSAAPAASPLTSPDSDSVVSNKDFASKFSKHFPVDVNTHYVYGNVAVINWGKINSSNPAFHTPKEIYPLGFKCVCLEHDVWLGKVVSLLCEVDASEDKSLPLLRITVAWELKDGTVDHVVYEGATARSVWLQVAQEVHGTNRPKGGAVTEALLDSDKENVSSINTTPAAFNIKSSRIAIDSLNIFFDDLLMRLIEGMNGAAECKSYVFFESKENEKNEVANCGANNIVKDMLRLQTKIKRLEKVKEVRVYEWPPQAPPPQIPYNASSSLSSSAAAPLATQSPLAFSETAEQRAARELWQRQLDERKRQREEKLREEFEVRKRMKDEERDKRIFQMQKEKNIFNDLARRARELQALQASLRIACRERARAAVDVEYQREEARHRIGSVSSQAAHYLEPLPAPRRNPADAVRGDVYAEIIEICTFLATFSGFLKPSFAVPRVSELATLLGDLYSTSSSSSKKGAISQLNEMCVCMCQQLTAEYETTVGAAPNVMGGAVPLNGLTWPEVVYQLLVAGICKAQRMSDADVTAMARGRGFSANATDSFEKRMLKHIRRFIIHDSLSIHAGSAAASAASPQEHASSVLRQLRSSRARMIVATRSGGSAAFAEDSFGESGDADVEDHDDAFVPEPLLIAPGEGSAHVLSAASTACYRVVCELLSHPSVYNLYTKLNATQKLYSRSVGHSVTLDDVRRCLLDGDYRDSITDFYLDVNSILEAFVVFAVDGSHSQLAAFKLLCVFDRLFFEMVLDTSTPLESGALCHTCRRANDNGAASRVIRCDRCDSVHHVGCVEKSSVGDDNSTSPHCVWTCHKCIRRVEPLHLSPLLGLKVADPGLPGAEGEVVGARRHCGSVEYVVSLPHSGRPEVWTAAEVKERRSSGSVCALPAGYSLDDYERACSVARGYRSLGSTLFIEPAVASASISRNACVPSDSHINLAAASILGTRGDGTFSSPREWTIVMKAIIGLLLKNSIFNVELCSKNAACDEAYKTFGSCNFLDTVQSCKMTRSVAKGSADLDDEEEREGGEEEDRCSIASSGSDVSWLSAFSDYERAGAKAEGGIAEVSAPLHDGDGDCDDGDGDGDCDDDLYNSYRLGLDDALAAQNMCADLLRQADWCDARDECGNIADQEAVDMVFNSVVKVCVMALPFPEDLVFDEWLRAWSSSMNEFLCRVAAGTSDEESVELCRYCGQDQRSIVGHMVWGQTFGEWCDEHSADTRGDAPPRFWRPCHSLHENAALAYHSGSLLAHECCADYMQKRREMAVQRGAKSVLREVFSRVKNGRNVPLGNDRLGNVYFFLFGSNSVAVRKLSSGSGRDPDPGDSESSCAVVNGFAAHIGSGDGALVGDEADGSCSWMQYEETADIARLVRWLGGAPCDRQLRIVLRCLFPEIREADCSSTLMEVPSEEGSSAIGAGDDEGDPYPDSIACLRAHTFLLDKNPSLLQDFRCADPSSLALLKAAMAVVSLAVPEPALRLDNKELFSEAGGRAFAPIWRAAVARAADADTLMQCALLLEASLRKEYFLRGTHLFAPSRTVAIKAPTLSAVAVRIYALDSALDYHYDC